MTPSRRSFKRRDWDSFSGATAFQRDRFSKVPMGRVLVMSVAFFSLSTVDISAQGTIDFQNFGAPVYDVDGKTPLTGPAFLAELFAAAPGDSLSAILSSISPFQSGGYILFQGPGDVAVPGTVPGGTALVQVVAWRASDGATFSAANHPGGHVGASDVFQVTGLGNNGVLPAAPLRGLQSFSLQIVVPEPSMAVLAVFGLGALALWPHLRRSMTH